MRNKLLVKLIIILSALLIGCSTHENADIAEEQASVSEQSTLILDREIVSGEESGVWLDSWYVDDILYYLEKMNNQESEQNKVRLCIKESEGTKSMFVAEDALYLSAAIDEQGDAYYISRPSEKECSLIKVNDQGDELYRQLLSMDVTELINKEMCIQGVATAEGYCIMTAYGTVVTWDAQLNETGQVIPAWQSMVMEYDAEQDYGLIVGSEGGYAYYRIGSDLTLQKIDMTAGKLKEEEPVELPIAVNDGTLLVDPVRLYSGYGNGIYVSQDDCIYIYNDKENVLEPRLEWKQSAVKVDMEDVGAIGEDENSSLIFAVYDMGSGQGSLIKAEETIIEDVQTVVIGYLNEIVFQSAERYITNFNMEHGDIQIAGKHYEDLTELHLDLIQGKGPDIIDLYSLDIDEYVEKGIFEPLDSYFQSSDKLNTEDILPTIRDAMTKDGAIRYVFPSFGMNVFIMNADVAKEDSMTTEEFLSLTLEGENNYLTETDAMTLLIYLLPLELDNYVDWKQKSCDFVSGEFVDFLELLNNADLPKTIEASASLFELPSAERIMDGRILASYFARIESLLDYRAVWDAFGENAKVVGFPTRQGEEVYPIYTNARWYAINSKSNKKEEAWEFLEHYLIEVSEECQNHYIYGFSVLSEYFEQQLYPKLEDGVDASCYQNYYTQDDERIEVKFDYTDEERNAIRCMVENAKVVEWGGDGVIGNIILEEVQAYFEGAKSAEEVADIIQRRVSIYMAE